MNVTSTIVWVTQILAQHSTSTIVIGYDTIPIRHNINAMPMHYSIPPTLNLLPSRPLLPLLLLLLAYEVVMAAMVQKHKNEPVLALLNLEREAQRRAVQRHQLHYEKSLSMAIKAKLNISLFDLDRLRHLLSFDYTATSYYSGEHTPVQLGDDIPVGVEEAALTVKQNQLEAAKIWGKHATTGMIRKAAEKRKFTISEDQVKE